MASLIYQGAFATGLKEDEAQSTLEPIRDDGSEAELSTGPEWNAVESDDSGELIGLSPRVVGSKTHDNEEGRPSDPLNLALASATHNEIIDRQVASSGTAAAREVSGQRGHGSVQWEEGIEPLNPAQVYGNSFFELPSLAANEGSGQYMTPAEGDNWPQMAQQRQALLASRKAAQNSAYSQFFGA